MIKHIIKSIKYRSNSPLSNFTVKDIRRMCEILNEYCETYLGVKKSKGLPSYSVRKDYSLSCYGQFNYEEHKIYVHYNVIPNIKLFVRTYVHEYAHSLQNARHYHNRLVKFGYQEHPDEVDARHVENIHHMAALEYLKTNL